MFVNVKVCFNGGECQFCVQVIRRVLKCFRIRSIISFIGVYSLEISWVFWGVRGCFKEFRGVLGVSMGVSRSFSVYFFVILSILAH